MTDISSADSLIRNIIEKQVKISELENEAKIAKENYSKKIDEWLEKVTQPLKDDIGEISVILMPIIEDYLTDLEKNSGIVTKSVKFPSGRAGFRSGGMYFSFTDKQLAEEKVDGKSEQLLKLVKEHGLSDYIVAKEYTDWHKLKKSLTVTKDGKVVTSQGEILPELIATREL